MCSRFLKEMLDLIRLEKNKRSPQLKKKKDCILIRKLLQSQWRFQLSTEGFLSHARPQKNTKQGRKSTNQTKERQGAAASHLGGLINSCLSFVPFLAPPSPQAPKCSLNLQPEKQEVGGTEKPRNQKRRELRGHGGVREALDR